MNILSKDKKIILFDGVCNLCNTSITFVIKNDKNDLFRYAPLQSEVGQFLTKKHGIDSAQTDSIILVETDRVSVKSTAALRIAKYLKGGYPLLYCFMIIPNFIRNWVYDYVATNRYKWYGKKDACMIPTAELKGKFLDKLQDV